MDANAARRSVAEWWPRITTLLVTGILGAVVIGSVASAKDKDDASDARRGEADRPIRDGLEAWREPRGDWTVAAGVSIDPKNQRRLSVERGTGVIVNGRAGRTRNFLTRKEYGDVHVHIEFVVPRGSNSGVYFMGR